MPDLEYPGIYLKGINVESSICEIKIIPAAPRSLASIILL